MPERKAARTPAGAPTTKKRLKREVADLYASWLASTVLATVKETFAVAPGIAEAQVLVVRRDPRAADPASYLTAVYVGRFARARLDTWDWDRLSPLEELLRAPDARFTRKGASQDVTALDLRDEPELAAVVGAVRDALGRGAGLGELVTRPAGPAPAQPPGPEAAVVMTKGGNLPLPTAALRATVWWRAGAAADLDVSALLCGRDGRALDPEAMVFYNQPTGAAGTVRTAGRGREADGGWNDGMLIDLARVPLEVEKVVVVVSLDGSGQAALQAVDGIQVVLSSDDGALASFPLSGLTTESAAVAVEVYRRNGAWRVRAVSQGWQDGLAGLARDFGIDVTS